MVNIENEELSIKLRRFNEVDNIQLRSQILRELIRDKTIHVIKNVEIVEEGIEKTLKLAKEAHDPRVRLEAVSLIERIASVVKSKRNELYELVKDPLRVKLPDLSYLKDPDDRLYVATSLNRTTEPWILDYASQFAVKEETAEKVRKTLISVVFKNTNELQDVFLCLSSPLKDLRPQTEAPSDSVAKRLIRILQAIRPQLVNYIGPAGMNIGENLNNMLKSAFFGTDKPMTPKLMEDLSEEIIGLLYDLLRTQIYVITDERTYSCITLIARWHDKFSWPTFARASENCKLVSKIISDSILLLAKQNRTDSKLFGQLSNILGSKEEAQKVTVKIAEQNPDLQSNVRDWLARGARERRTKVLNHIEESDQYSSDSSIALALLETHKFSRIASNISQDSIIELKIFESKLGEDFERLLKSSKKLTGDIENIARRRNLSLRYTIGERVEYSPISHELITGHEEGIRWVNVVRPLVERKSLSGSQDIIIKALVEKDN